MISDNWPAVWRPIEDWASPTYEGGVLPPGSTIVHNGSVPVLIAEQVAYIREVYGPCPAPKPAEPAE